jgi:CheY-like chemotaxis protein
MTIKNSRAAVPYDKKPRIMVGDNHNINIELMKLEFHALGLEASTSWYCDGRKALEKVKEEVNDALLNAK